MSKRIDRRTFVRSALTAGAGVLLAPSAGVERRAEGAAGHRGRLRPGRRLGRARHQRHHPVDAPGRRERLGQRRLRGRARRGLREGHRERNGGGRRRGRLHRAPARERRLPEARRAVLLPLQDRERTRRRSGAFAPPGRPDSQRAGADRLLLLPGVHRGLLRRPAATSPSRTSTSSSASATTSTSRPSFDGLDQRTGHDRRRPRRRRRRRYAEYRAQVLALPLRREPAASVTPPTPLVGDVGRPRGRGQLRRRPARRREPRAAASPSPSAAPTATARGSSTCRAVRDAGASRRSMARCSLGARRALHPRPRASTAATSRATRRTQRSPSRARRPRPTTRRARCSAPSRRRG